MTLKQDIASLLNGASLAMSPSTHATDPEWEDTWSSAIIEAVASHVLEMPTRTVEIPGGDWYRSEDDWVSVHAVIERIRKS